jgi:hypothetical protein
MDEQGVVFADQGARNGLSGGEQGRELGVDSSDSNFVDGNAHIVILIIIANPDIRAELCVGKQAIDTRRCPAERGRLTIVNACSHYVLEVENLPETS